MPDPIADDILSRLQTSMEAATILGPDKGAQYVKAADSLGVSPLDMPDPALAEEQTRSSLLNLVPSLARIADTHRETASWLMKPSNSILAQDDLPAVITASEALKQMRAWRDREDLPWKQGMASNIREATYRAAALTGAIPAEAARNLFGDNYMTRSWYATWDAMKAEQAQRAEYDESLAQTVAGGASQMLTDPTNFLLPGMTGFAARGATGTGVATAKAVAARQITASLTTEALGQFASSVVQRQADRPGTEMAPLDLTLSAVDGLWTGFVERLAGGTDVAKIGQKLGSVREGLGDVGMSAASEAIQGIENEYSMAAGRGEIASARDVALSASIGGLTGGLVSAARLPFDIHADIASAARDSVDATHIVKNNQLAETIGAVLAQSKITARSGDKQQAWREFLDANPGSKELMQIPREDYDKLMLEAGKDPSKELAAMKGGMLDEGTVAVSIGEFYMHFRKDLSFAGKLREKAIIGDAPGTMEDAKAIFDTLESELTRIADMAANPTLFGGVKDDSQDITKEVEGALRSLPGIPKSAAEVAPLYAEFYTASVDAYNRAAQAEGKPLITPKQLWDKQKVSFQAGPDGPNKGGYDPIARVLKLNERANASTIIHESGHHFLTQLEVMAGEPEAPQLFKDLQSTFSKWIDENAGHVVDIHNTMFPGEAITVDQLKVNAPMAGVIRARQEYFARGFEAWVKEGKAPSKGLRRLFHRFAAWMSRIYSKNPSVDVRLTDDARAMMRRLFLTADAVDAATEQAAVGAVGDKLAEEAGLDPVEVAKWRERKETAISDLHAEVTAKLAKEVRKKDTEERHRFRAETAMEVASEMVVEEPVYELMQILENESSFRINAQDVKKSLDPRYVEALTRRGYLSPDGETLDELAQRFGAPDGVSLGESAALLRPFSDEFHDRMNVREQERFGDSINDEQAYAIAKELLAGPEQQRLIEAEKRLLAKASYGTSPVRKKDIAKAKDKAQKQATKYQETVASLKRMDKWKSAEAKARAERRIAELQSKIDELKVQSRWDDAAWEKAVSAEKTQAKEKAASQKQAINAINEISYEEIKSAAEANIGRMTLDQIKRLRPTSLRNQAAAHGRQSLTLVGREKFQEAYSAKVRQQFALENARLVEEYKDRMDTAVKTIDRFASSDDVRSKLTAGGVLYVVMPDGKKIYKGADGVRPLADRKEAEALADALGGDVGRETPHSVLVDQLLSKFGFSPVPYNPATMQTAIQSILEGGLGLPDISTDILTAPAGKFDEMSVDLIDSFATSLGNILTSHNALNRNYVLQGRDNAKAFAERKKEQAKKYAGSYNKDAFVSKFTDAADAFLNVGLTIRTRFNTLDGGRDGAFFEEVYQPLIEAMNTRARMLDGWLDTMNKAMDVLDKKEKRLWVKSVIPGTNIKMSMWDRMGLAMHYGSETGRAYAVNHVAALTNLNPAQAHSVVQKALASLGTAHLDFIDSMWAMNEQAMDVAIAEYKLRGEKLPERLKPMAYKIGDRVMAGGYFTYDPKHKKDPLSIDTGFGEVLNGTNLHSFFPGNGYTKNRTKAPVAELHLGPDVLLRHLNKVASDIALRPVAQDMNRLFMTNGLHSTLVRSHGQRFADGLWSEVKATIAGPSLQGDGFQKYLRLTRHAMTTAGLGLKPVTAIKQLAGVIPLLGETRVSKINVAQAAMAILTNPKEAWETARAKSIFMKERLGITDPNMADAVQRASAGKFWSKANRLVMLPITLVQQPVDMLTWHSAYLQAKENKKSEAQAVKWADQIVRDVQGSGDYASLTPMHRNEYTRTLTMFGTYFTTLYNSAYRSITTVKRKPDAAAAYRLASTAFWTFLMATLAEGIMEGLLKEDGSVPGAEEDLRTWMLRNSAKTALSSHPIMRPISTLIVEGKGEVSAPHLQALKGLGKTIAEVAELGDADAKKLATEGAKALPLVPYVGGLPWGAARQWYEGWENDSWQSAIFGQFYRPAH